MQALSHDEARTARIRDLNDAFRRTFSGGNVVMTAGVDELPDMVKAEALKRAATFSDFDEECRDAGTVAVAGRHRSSLYRDDRAVLC